MSLLTAVDITVHVKSENASAERRVTPSWTIGQFKAKLELVTGIPPSSQRLTLKLGAETAAIPIEAADEENTQLSAFPLAPHAEIYVSDSRPPGMRPNYTDVSQVDKYEMPTSEYEQKTDSVLAWKKNNKLGRFNPDAPSMEQARVETYETEIKKREIAVGKRCRIGGQDEKRGTVMYVGDVEEIPGGLGKWVGIKLDEPVGKNDGSIGGKRYWGTETDAEGPKYGVFVRPERVEVGDYPALDDLDDMEEM